MVSVNTLVTLCTYVLWIGNRVRLMATHLYSPPLKNEKWGKWKIVSSLMQFLLQVVIKSRILKFAWSLDSVHLVSHLFLNIHCLVTYDARYSTCWSIREPPTGIQICLHNNSAEFFYVSPFLLLKLTYKLLITHIHAYWPWASWRSLYSITNSCVPRDMTSS